MNANTCTFAELESLPGMSADHANMIVEHRPYKDITDLEARTGFLAASAAAVLTFV